MFFKELERNGAKIAHVVNMFLRAQKVPGHDTTHDATLEEGEAILRDYYANKYKLKPKPKSKKTED